MLAVAYYCGGYVAGRMSRFDGARQGIGVWAIGLLITLAVAVLAVVAGSEYNVVERANLPRLPVGDETLTTGRRDREPRDPRSARCCSRPSAASPASRYHHKVDRAGISRVKALRLNTDRNG